MTGIIDIDLNYQYATLEKIDSEEVKEEIQESEQTLNWSFDEF